MNAVSAAPAPRATDSQLAQLVAHFQLLDAYGQRVVLAQIGAMVKLQGAR